MLKHVGCILGIHKWVQSRPLVQADAFPPPFVKYDTPTRKCEHCSKGQNWLPGYGGSEFGCWIDKV
jgi:hypothetical protein